jgi:hypothetical protein
MLYVLEPQRITHIEAIPKAIVENKERSVYLKLAGTSTFYTHSTPWEPSHGKRLLEDAATNPLRGFYSSLVVIVSESFFCCISLKGQRSKLADEQRSCLL